MMNGIKQLQEIEHSRMEVIGVLQAVNYTRGLLRRVAEMLPRSISQKAGPKSHNQILSWAKLEASDLSNLKNQFDGNDKRTSSVATKISKLFAGILDSNALGFAELQAELAAVDLSKMPPDQCLALARRCLCYLCNNHAERRAELQFILDVCERLIAQRLESPSDKITSANQFASASNIPLSKRSIAWITASVLTVLPIIALLYIWLPSGASPEENIPTAVVANPNIISKVEAQKRILVLIENSHGFAARGDDANYFASVKAAYDLTEDVFGTASIEFARANNHMVGAYETTGHPELAIEASRAALGLFRKLLGPTSRNALLEQVNLGARLSRIHNVKSKSEARQLLVDAISKYERHQKTPSLFLNLAHAYEAYSIYFSEVGDWHNAVLQSLISVQFVEVANAQNIINRGWIIANHAEMLFRTGRCEEAVAMYKRAVAAYEQAQVPITQRDHAFSLSQLYRKCSG